MENFGKTLNILVIVLISVSSLKRVDCQDVPFNSTDDNPSENRTLRSIDTVLDHLISIAEEVNSHQEQPLSSKKEDDMQMQDKIPDSDMIVQYPHHPHPLNPTEHLPKKYFDSSQTQQDLPYDDDEDDRSSSKSISSLKEQRGFGTKLKNPTDEKLFRPGYPRLDYYNFPKNSAPFPRLFESFPGFKDDKASSAHRHRHPQPPQRNNYLKHPPHPEPHHQGFDEDRNSITEHDSGRDQESIYSHSQRDNNAGYKNFHRSKDQFPPSSYHSSFPQNAPIPYPQGLSLPIFPYGRATSNSQGHPTSAPDHQQQRYPHPPKHLRGYGPQKNGHYNELPEDEYILNSGHGGDRDNGRGGDRENGHGHSYSTQVLPQQHPPRSRFQPGLNAGEEDILPGNGLPYPSIANVEYTQGHKDSMNQLQLVNQLSQNNNKLYAALTQSLRTNSNNQGVYDGAGDHTALLGHHNVVPTYSNVQMLWRGYGYPAMALSNNHNNNNQYSVVPTISNNVMDAEENYRNQLTAVNAAALQAVNGIALAESNLSPYSHSFNTGLNTNLVSPYGLLGYASLFK